MSKEQQLQLDTILRSGQIDADADVPALRAAFAGFTAQVPVPPDVQQEPRTIGGIDALEVSTPGADADRVILYFHSGVYVIGSAAGTVPLVADLSRRTAARAITVDYRLAPEHPYPAALDDAEAAYEGLLGDGLDPRQIALAGESAGAGLAVALLLRLRERGATMPSCAVLVVALRGPDAVGGHHVVEGGGRPAALAGESSACAFRTTWQTRTRPTRSSVRSSATFEACLLCSSRRVRTRFCSATPSDWRRGPRSTTYRSRSRSRRASRTSSRPSPRCSMRRVSRSTMPRAS